MSRGDWGTHLDSLDTPPEFVAKTAEYRRKRRKMTSTMMTPMATRSLLCRADEAVEELLNRITVLENIISGLQRVLTEIAASPPTPTRDPGGTP